MRRPPEVGLAGPARVSGPGGPFGCPSSSPHAEVCRLSLAPQAGSAGSQPPRGGLLLPPAPPHPASRSIPAPTPLGRSSPSPGRGPAPCGPSQRSHEMARARRAARAAGAGWALWPGGRPKPPRPAREKGGPRCASDFPSSGPLTGNCGREGEGQRMGRGLGLSLRLPAPG